MARMLATFLLLLALSAIIFNHANGQDSKVWTPQQATHTAPSSTQYICDVNGGWTVFQRRYDGSIDFFRDWDEYVNGFGRWDGEFWLGLEKLHQLTKAGSWRLKVILEDWDGSTGYAEYASFRIGDEASNYQLTVKGYSGTAGDSLDWHNGMAFSTKDRDNDGFGLTNCASGRKGAWWYNACATSNLNGLYLGQSGNDYTGMGWHHWKDSWQSLKSSTMMIKEVWTPQQATHTVTSSTHYICDGGWTIFQRRYDGSIDFFRDWDEYVNGFGRWNGEFWLGLEKLHQQTRNGSWRLKVTLEDWDGSSGYAEYDTFSIGDEASNYQLTVGGYSGTAGDSLAYHNGMAFSTKDRDNDLWSATHCADIRKGGWWYKSCYRANLNGMYLGQSGSGDSAMAWYYWKNSWQSYKSSTMMIRPK